MKKVMLLASLFVSVSAFSASQDDDRCAELMNKAKEKATSCRKEFDECFGRALFIDRAVACLDDFTQCDTVAARYSDMAAQCNDQKPKFNEN